MEQVTIHNATLYCGNCFELVEQFAFAEAVVTDPPYGLGERMQGGTWGAAEKYADMRQWDVAPPSEWLVTHLAPLREAIIWGGNYFALPPARCWFAWDKVNAVPTMADIELAWTNLDQPAKRYAGPVGVHAHGHPTEKPLPLMEWCLYKLKGATVADPFMGSGTTGVACANLGKAFVGVEADRRYFDIACERIKRAYSQQRLFA